MSNFPDKAKRVVRDALYILLLHGKTQKEGKKALPLTFLFIRTEFIVNDETVCCPIYIQIFSLFVECNSI